MERLQKVIANSGIASRRKAEELIKEGCVKVNGSVVTELGTKVTDRDKIEVNNKPIIKEEKVYFLLNKPRGVITSTKDEHGRKTVIDLIDTDTGAIILTNDGEFANILMHPSNKIDKVYLAKIDGIITGEAINTLKDGIILDGVKVVPSRVKLKKVNPENNTSMVEVTIHEGKNHEVKRLFESVGFRVDKLTRKSVGIFDILELPSGKYRPLTHKEVQIVYSYKNKKI